MRARVGLAFVALVLTAAQAQAISDADKCEAAKNKIAGKYAFCRQKAEAKAIKTGDAVDYSKCDTNFSRKWATAETRGGGMCPTTGDQSGIQNQVTAAADSIALKLTGVRFVDNGDGTVTDLQTGLMWEQKTGDSTVHDKDNLYTWSATGTTPDGTAFTTFLGTLNHGASGDGNTISGCFAGQCDWRLPTNAELQTILLAPFSCGTTPCIDPIFGPTQSFFYWSPTTGDPGLAWFVDFSYGFVFEDGKTNNFYVWAVRKSTALYLA